MGHSYKRILQILPLPAGARLLPRGGQPTSIPGSSLDLLGYAVEKETHTESSSTHSVSTLARTA